MSSIRLAVVLTLFGSIASAQSLGDVAKKEKERRAKNKGAVAVIDDDALAGYRDPNAPLEDPDADEAEDTANAPSGSEPSASGQATPARSSDTPPPPRAEPPSSSSARTGTLSAEEREWRKRVAQSESRLENMKEVARRCEASKNYQNTLPTLGCDGIEDRIARAEGQLAELKQKKP